MPRKKVIDAEKLIQAIDSERPSKDIMAEFGFKTSAQLKSYYLDAMIATGKAKGIVSRPARAVKAAGKPEAIKINKRGSLILPKAVIDGLGFSIGEAFIIRKTKAGLAVRKK